jgi:TPP-dependent pyruvate/acetoin dehydrogenase alpha subunit
MGSKLTTLFQNLDIIGMVLFRDFQVLLAGNPCKDVLDERIERHEGSKEHSHSDACKAAHALVHQSVAGVEACVDVIGSTFGIALGSKLEGDGAIIYAIVGDGESQEGQIWEAAMFAAAKKLDNLICFTDYNKLQIDDSVANVCDIAPLADKWRAFGWNVIEVENGNDVEAVKSAVDEARKLVGSGKPTQVILHTVKGCGVSFIEAAGAANHNMNLSPEQTEAALREVEGAC